MLDQHLRDCFKNRQEVLSFFSFLEQLQICKIHLGRLQFMIELEQLLDKLRILAQGPAVSYTHLDVYKRQVLA